jgi:hypothetical protein
MSTFIFILFLLLTTAAIAARFSKRQPNLQETSHHLPASQFDGLLAEQRAEEVKTLAENEASYRDRAARQQLLERAAEAEMEGMTVVLNEAQAFGDQQFYHQVLQTIFTQADGNLKLLRSTVEYIVGSQKLRSSREFAEAVVALWANSPGQFSLADVLCLAALADDEAVFRQALNTALKLWREDRIRKVSAHNFLAAVENAYWLIASDVRSSGSGFLLKQAIADVRRALAAADRRRA